MIAGEPLISIIVPIYNVQEYLPKCISSIRQQTYKNIQIILVDDGSTDDSPLICDTEAMQDSRIEVIHQENKGLVAARKAGLCAAKGVYIGFVDGDDCIEENMYEELLDGLVKSNADFIHSGFYENGTKVRIINDYEEGKYDISKGKADVICDNVLKVSSNNKMTIAPSIWSKLYKANLIKEAYSNVPDCQQYGEDVISLCACILMADAMVLSRKAYYQYTVRMDSMSHISDIKNIVKYTGLYTALCILFKKYNIYGDVEKKMDLFLLQFGINYISSIYGGRVSIQKYRFPAMHELREKKIVIYGAGRVGKDYFQQIAGDSGCQIVGWIDKNFRQYQFEDVMIQGPEALMHMEYDLIVIAVKDEQAAAEIRESLSGMNVSREKVLWCRPEIWHMLVN